ncbi:carbohydrate-binding family 9-like protein [Breznakiella homolactica]|uniref:Carbohydrate-binding family 9-like protein n=1 Tax=Breznakiella homolactica TaxID=2798577 RepID=A0A7T7XNT6_9SPIR|nr:carbohydrate-binding family 9-like protein [Breznakiella homolactica]QQO09746.1 carbohydrate-binding family 9-like protein [Breznakiella homolactica]
MSNDLYRGISEDRLAHYTCCRTSGPITIDGDLEKPVWKNAQKSRRFVDLVSGEPGFLDTRIATLWDDKNLYVAFWLDEPFLRASQTERDSFIWFDNDIEVFFDGEDCYYEFEVNTYNTIYEVFFIYQDALKKGGRFDTPEFDLYNRNVDILCGFQDASRIGKHPRGKRWAFMDYDFPGLKSAVKTYGTMNDSSDIDKGWTVEIAFPWEGIQKMYATRSFPPKEGDTLRAAFFRFEALQYHGKTVDPSVAWSLNEHGVYDSHIPESFSYLHFTEKTS